MRFLLLALLFLAPQAFAKAEPTRPLNDTGQNLCFDGSTNTLAACTQANTGDGSTHPRQDGRFGRDAEAGAGELTKIGAGAAGFDFTPLDAAGNVIALDAAGVPVSPHSCTRDNVTGLIWSTETISDVEWQQALDQAQSYGRCGLNGWRVPNRRELLSIVDHGTSEPAIDRTFFPNTQSAVVYWSSDPLADRAGVAWGVSFGTGSTPGVLQSRDGLVRFVRSGQ